MTNDNHEEVRYTSTIEGLEFIKVSNHIYKTKDGKKYPWRSLIVLDGLGEPYNFTLHKDCDVPEIEPATPIVIQVQKDRYKKEKVVLIGLE